ncbi:MAG TPA: undecaprenyl-phosphate glucose phosphotransferase [Candidatus Limiplasma sp.]|nr:undecaprenyl-phosphate glucose phosphotransferase [Candidatus Limiplasma sp.]HPS81447.1 undecaprenyl-phosphate glucose phosphotransferase [Candidatus Limiplasma sp.]
MIKQNQRLLNFINAFTDGVIVLLSYLFASWLWLVVLQGTADRNMATVHSLWSGVGVAATVYALATVLLLALFRIYNSSRIRRLKQEILIVLEVNAIGILAIGSLLFLFRLQDFSRGVLGLFFLTGSLLLIAKRFALRSTLSLMRSKGFNQKHVIVVGTAGLAMQYARSVAAETELGFHIDGFVGKAQEGAEFPLLGGFDSLESLIQKPGIDEVIVALEPDETNWIKPVIATCEKCGTKVGIIPFYNDIIPAHPTIEIIGETKLINLRSNPLDNMGLAFLKRGSDILISLILLVVFSPMMLIAAIGVKLTSPGPILFRQKRVGLNKHEFDMLKFRSMRVNAAETSGWTTDADPRRTRFGSFLRKFSIDELPQFINVFRGDMSLVGPRPEVPYYVDQFRESIPLYMVKHQVRPGITGWAQVNGYRGDTSIEKRIAHDIWYIENWSLGLDVRILFKTLLGAWLNNEKVFTGTRSP